MDPGPCPSPTRGPPAGRMGPDERGSHLHRPELTGTGQCLLDLNCRARQIQVHIAGPQTEHLTQAHAGARRGQHQRAAVVLGLGLSIRLARSRRRSGARWYPSSFLYVT